MFDDWEERISLSGVEAEELWSHVQPKAERSAVCQGGRYIWGAAVAQPECPVPSECVL